MATFEWSDLRYFLAVARTGATATAARTLNVNQTTCARRIAALEQSLNVTLFERAASGYKLTTIGAALVVHAERAEAGAEAFGRRVTELQRAGHGLLRFTTSDWMAELIAQSAVAEFARLHPDIRIELDVSGGRVDLSGGEADVALRGGFSLDDPTLIARKIAETPWGFYCSKDYAARNGAPRTMAEALNRPLALPAGQAEDILRSLHPDLNIVYSSNSTVALMEAIADGPFVGPLPRAAGDNRDDLHYCCEVEYATPSIWIVYPERLRGAPHVRAFVDHLYAHLSVWWRHQSPAEDA